MYCKNCGREIDGKLAYCPECGKPVQTVGTPGELTGNQEQPNIKSAGSPSANPNAPYAAPQPMQTAAPQPTQPQPPKKKGTVGKVIIGIVIAFVVLLVIGMCASGNSGSRSQSNSQNQPSTQAESSDGQSTQTTEQESDKTAPAQKTYEAIPYNSLVRTPDQYKGKAVTISGSVLQVDESDSSRYVALVAVDDDYSPLAGVVYKPSLLNVRLLEDDPVTVNGEFLGLDSYTTVLGSDNTVPVIQADSITMR